MNNFRALECHARLEIDRMKSACFHKERFEIRQFLDVDLYVLKLDDMQGAHCFEL